MLSAVLQLLQGIQFETSRDRKQAIIDLCSSAYPDVRPWQVETACRPAASNDVNTAELYYSYLSLLLHPLDGNDLARRDPLLVNVSVFLVLVCNRVCISLPYLCLCTGVV